MPILRSIHRVALRVEKLFERVLLRRSRPPLFEAYRGYAKPETLVVRGRVLTGLRRGTPREQQSTFTNFRQMLALFLTDEVAGVEVVAQGRSVRSDEEGYVTLELPRGNAPPGWQHVSVSLPDAVDVTVGAPVLIPSAEAAFGVISDIDDTMMRTGAWNGARNLWTSLTGNAATREVFPDAVALMERLHDGRNPVFYVSSSPWNLHGFLDEVLFQRAGLVAGPVFLRDYGLSETQFVTGTHGSHKGAAIDRIMAANPELGFVLIGDTGQHDAEVYAAAMKRRPGRVQRVILRGTVARRDASAEQALEDLRSAGIPADVVADYGALEL
ncbi:App1 family protein [Pontivivens ytuae]|uniref:DUF2183 domain-containing protein n=1 Tax=Pontivivens ytuae TaxID=2789856 RepID=A0A7S9QEG3_9RHOB|nr:phosphatase domain-containing protein [Pontivivens ytuae]QPH55940.1 DUF2183 domain-containing protein [Pontivivens ytuae]